MTLYDYIKFRLDIATKRKEQPDLENIYDMLMKKGFDHKEIYLTINKIILENIEKIVDDYQKGRKQ